MNTKKIWYSFLVLGLACINLFETSAFAARKSSISDSSSSYSGGSSLLVDISGHYVRDTKPNGLSDFATRFSIGGMFSNFVGLDLLGHYETKSRSYLVGADLRISPVPWLFLKGGIGGYSIREGKRFEIVPLAGAGIIAPITDATYLVSEVTYFQTSTHYNITFGGGLGMRF